MTRNGKIARLPHNLREQLNHRLRDGESGRKLIAWLNGLPEVQSIMRNGFAGRPLNNQNLTEWRQGGYRDWVSNLGITNLETNVRTSPSPDNPVATSQPQVCPACAPDAAWSQAAEAVGHRMLENLHDFLQLMASVRKPSIETRFLMIQCRSRKVEAKATPPSSEPPATCHHLESPLSSQ